MTNRTRIIVLSVLLPLYLGGILAVPLNVVGRMTTGFYVALTVAILSGLALVGFILLCVRQDNREIEDRISRNAKRPIKD